MAAASRLHALVRRHCLAFCAGGAAPVRVRARHGAGAAERGTPRRQPPLVRRASGELHESGAGILTLGLAPRQHPLSLLAGLLLHRLQTLIHLVSRRTGRRTHVFEADAFFFLHVINCFERPSLASEDAPSEPGEVVVDICCYKDPAMISCMYIDALEVGERSWVFALRPVNRANPEPFLSFSLAAAGRAAQPRLRATVPRPAAAVRAAARPRPPGIRVRGARAAAAAVWPGL